MMMHAYNFSYLGRWEQEDLEFEASLGIGSSETLFKKKKKKKAVFKVERLPSMYNDIGSIPSTTHKKKNILALNSYI
jgi:hypothetical protein